MGRHLAFADCVGKRVPDIHTCIQVPLCYCILAFSVMYIQAEADIHLGVLPLFPAEVLAFTVAASHAQKEEANYIMLLAHERSCPIINMSRLFRVVSSVPTGSLKIYAGPRSSSRHFLVFSTYLINKHQAMDIEFILTPWMMIKI